MKSIYATALLFVFLFSTQELHAQWSTGHLSTPRENISGISAGRYAVFAGGDDNNGASNRVDIYDFGTQTWDTMTMPFGTSQQSGTAYNSKVYVPGDGLLAGFINIIDLSTMTLSTDTLPHLRGFVATVAAGGKIFYAGGQDISGVSDVVDIYDVNTKLWTTSHLSVARRLLVAATAGDKIVFAGGESDEEATRSNAVDIYDVNSGVWATDTLSQARTHLVAAAAGTRILIAGGNNTTTSSDRVDIYDVVTGKWSIDSLSIARRDLAASVLGNKIYFGGGTDGNSYFDRVDIYNADSGTWNRQSLCLARYALSAATAGDQIIFAGGLAVNTATRTDTADIFTDTSVIYTGVATVSDLMEMMVFPNPASGKITLSDGSNSAGKMNSLNLIDLSGQILFSAKNIPFPLKIDVSQWANGIYFIQAKSGRETFLRKFIVQH